MAANEAQVVAGYIQDDLNCTKLHEWGEEFAGIKEHDWVPVDTIDPWASHSTDQVLNEVDGMLLWQAPMAQSSLEPHVSQEQAGPSAEQCDHEALYSESEDEEMRRLLDPFGSVLQERWDEMSPNEEEGDKEDELSQLRERSKALEEEKRLLMARLHTTEAELVAKTLYRRAESLEHKKSSRKSANGILRNIHRPKPTSSTKRKHRKVREKKEVLRDLRVVFDEQCCIGESEVAHCI